VVGVALDQNDLVEQYRDTAGIDYPLLVGDLDAVDVAKAYGNSYGELPYTVFIDRQGHIAAIHRGGITKDAAEAAIKKLL
jgi:peroxiredoxin